MMPSVINRDGKIENNDAVIVYNYRSDRLRELFASLTNDKGEDVFIPQPIKEYPLTYYRNLGGLEWVF